MVVNPKPKFFNGMAIHLICRLRPLALPPPPNIKTKPFKRLLKSTNPQYSRLIVVDKENGGTKVTLKLSDIHTLDEALHFEYSTTMGAPVLEVQ